MYKEFFNAEKLQREPSLSFQK